MIQANELRIGNWVEAGSASYQIKSICNDDRDECGVGNQWTYDGLYYDYSFDEIQPIPLTPSILEKCGFERTIGTLTVNRIECAEFYFVKHFYSKITQDYNDRNWFDVTYNYTRGEHNEEELLCSVQSLHQLQNLYFALTGEELIVNL